MGKIDIIVCSHNNEDIISRCLDSVKKQTFKDFNCILVDDNSSDGTADIVKSKYRWVKIIKKDGQTGPTISRNTAIELTEGEFIATLDSDVQLDRNWLREQVKLLQSDASIGIAASKILYSWDTQRINSCGGGMTKEGFGFDILCGEDVGKQKVYLRPVLYGHSAAMLVRRKMLQEIGIFDSTYFYGNEDTDIGWRANIACWKVMFNPMAIAYHDENATIKNMAWSTTFHGTKNRIRSLIKNYSSTNVIKYLPIHMLMVLGKTAVSNNKSARLNAIAWNTAHILSTLKERQHVQKTRKIGDKDIMTHVFSEKLPMKRKQQNDTSFFAPKKKLVLISTKLYITIQNIVKILFNYNQVKEW